MEAVAAYAAGGIVPFHTPGHKQGRGADPFLLATLGAAALRVDVSDVLLSPRFNDSWTEALAAAQRLAAEALGADYCFFLVNGTTVGVHAMVLAAAAGRKIIVARNSHRSVVGAVVLADAWPVYVDPVYDQALGVWLPPAPSTWERAMEEHPDAAAVLVTYPTYEGATADLPAIVRAARKRGMIVLVDEAHGPHFGWHPDLPPRAVAVGADASAQSPHKLLGALTQASWLLGRDGALPRAAVETVLGILQSTSPSALLLGSLDAARRQMALEGRRLASKALEAAARVEAAVARLPGLRRVRLQDPTKLLIAVDGAGWNGYAAAAALRRMGVQVEMATARHVLALATLGDDEETVARLCGALERLACEAPPPGSPWAPWDEAALDPSGALRGAGRLVMRPREAALGRTRAVPLREAMGLVAADVVCPYPPGVPVLCPGEQVSAEAVEYLQAILDKGGEVRGLAGSPEAPAVRVVEAR